MDQMFVYQKNSDSEQLYKRLFSNFLFLNYFLLTFFFQTVDSVLYLVVWKKSKYTTPLLVTRHFWLKLFPEMCAISGTPTGTTQVSLSVKFNAHIKS